MVTPSCHSITPWALLSSLPTYYRPLFPTTIESLDPWLWLALLLLDSSHSLALQQENSIKLLTTPMNYIPKLLDQAHAANLSTLHFIWTHIIMMLLHYPRMLSQ
jgi:hypothetical protein